MRQNLQLDAASGEIPAQRLKVIKHQCDSRGRPVMLLPLPRCYQKAGADLAVTLFTASQAAVSAGLSAQRRSFRNQTSWFIKVPLFSWGYDSPERTCVFAAVSALDYSVSNIFLGLWGFMPIECRGFQV